MSRTAPLAALTVVALVLSFFLALGRYPLFDVDEGAFSQATLEMFQRDDFLSTTLNGEPRYDKPILVYWLQAAAVSLLGASELAFRLPSALCATLWCVLVFLFVRRRFGVRTALLAATALGTSLAVSIMGRVATADALLNMLLAAAMLAAWLHLETGRARWLYAASAAMGLGFLAKGPIALLIPLAVTAAFCLMRRNLRTWLRLVFHPGALALFAAIALPWYAITLYRDGWGFIEGFFLRHNVHRFSAPMQGHAGSVLYYIPVLLIATLPFTAWLVNAFARWKAIWRDDLQLYLALWFLFVFVFFSVAATKLPHYLIYGLTGLVILMAIHGAELRSRFWALLPPLLVFLGLAAFPSILRWTQGRVADPDLRGVLAEAAARLGAPYLLYVAAAAAAVVALMLERRWPLPEKLVATGAAVALAVSAFLTPAVGHSVQDAVKDAGLLARERGYDVVSWGINVPSFSVYYGRPTPRREPAPGEVLLTKARRLPELKQPFTVLYERRGVALVRLAR